MTRSGETAPRGGPNQRPETVAILAASLDELAQRVARLEQVEARGVEDEAARLELEAAGVGQVDRAVAGFQHGPRVDFRAPAAASGMTGDPGWRGAA
jgi:hypothetical protein